MLLLVNKKSPVWLHPPAARETKRMEKSATHTTVTFLSFAVPFLDVQQDFVVHKLAHRLAHQFLSSLNSESISMKSTP